MELVSSLARIQIQDTFPLKLPFLALNSGLNTNAQNCAVQMKSLASVLISSYYCGQLPGAQQTFTLPQCEDQE